MVDIERNYGKKSRGINLLNHIFKKRNRRNLNEIVKCLSGNSSDKLDHLLSRSSTNVNEMCSVNDNQTDNKKNSQNNQNNNRNDDNHSTNNLNNQRNNKEPLTSNQLELIDYSENAKRRLSTPNIVPNMQTNLDKKFTCKKLSLKARRSFSPKSRLIINNQNLNQKKLSLDQELLEHYNQLSTECNSSYMSLISNSPISPRVKSIDEDIEALTLSRQDNPYIQNKLEKLSQYSGVNYDILSISNLSLNGNSNFVNSTNTLNNQSTTHSSQFSQSNKVSSISSEELDEILNFSKSNKDENLHEHLIRSPPPDFPLNFSSFIFPAVGSPLRSLSMKYNNSLNSNDTTSIKTPNLYLSPLHKQMCNQSPKKDNLFFANSTKNRLKNLHKSTDNHHLSTNENDVELIITN